MLHKILPYVLIVFVSACTNVQSTAGSDANTAMWCCKKCECCQTGKCECCKNGQCSCCKDGMCTMCQGKKDGLSVMNEGKQCSMCFKAAREAKPHMAK